MKPLRYALAGLAVVLVARAAAADGRNALSFWDETPPTIVVYDDRCDVDVECWTESVSCDGPTVVVSIGGFYTDQMTRWMMNGMEAFVSGFDPVPQLRLREITISDMDGLWYAELETTPSQPLDIQGEQLVFDSTIRTTTVALDEQNRAELTKFVAACGSAPALIDLRAATLQVEAGGGGFLSYVDGVFGGFTIANGVVIENATGGSGADALIGNAAANVLDGAGGADVMRGLGGNDSYVVDNAGDVVDESAAGSAGTDTILSFISFNLGDASRAQGDIENLTLVGSSAVNGTGNALANVIVGNAGVNVLSGGLGKDSLAGGGAFDAFLFDVKAKSANADHLTDMLHGTDKIWLDKTVYSKLKVGNLKKSAFYAHKNADEAKDGKDRIVYDTNSGECYYDKDGVGGKNAKLLAIIDNSPDYLSHKDFLVIA